MPMPLGGNIEMPDPAVPKPAIADNTVLVPDPHLVLGQKVMGEEGEILLGGMEFGKERQAFSHHAPVKVRDVAGVPRGGFSEHSQYR